MIAGPQSPARDRSSVIAGAIGAAPGPC